MLPLHHRSTSGRPGSNGPRRSGAPVLFLLSYVRKIRPAGLEPATSAVAERRSSPLSYERLGLLRRRCRLCRRRLIAARIRAKSSWRSRTSLGKSLRQESNPHLGRTKGACLPLTLRRRIITRRRCRLGRRRLAVARIRPKSPWLRRSRSRTSAGDGDGGSRTRSSSVQARCSAARASSPHRQQRKPTGLRSRTS